MAKLPPRGRHSRILGFGASSSKRRVLQSSLFYNRKNRLSRLASPPTFSISDIPGLRINLDASLGDNVISHVENAASQIDDTTGFLNHGVQDSASNKPLTNTRTFNGLNCLDFNGSTSFMSILDGNSWLIPNGDNTIFMALDFDNASAEQRLWSGGSGSGTRWGMLWSRNTNSFEVVSSNNFDPVDVTIVETTGRKILALRRTGTLVEGFVGGALETGSDTVGADFGGIDSLMLGAAPTGTTRRFNGGFGQVSVWETSLSDVDFNKVGNLFKGKWGTSWLDI